MHCCVQLRFIGSRINGQAGKGDGRLLWKRTKWRKEIHDKGTCFKLAELVMEKLSLKCSLFFKSIL